MDMRRLVGKNFARLRDERNMTQEDVAAATGISQQYLSGLERGKRNPTIITIYEISLALDVDPMELLRRNKKSKD
ncbi:helix-turn-helix transcriptional regulator [uncultured Roseibium sp.]|uniref:helix-turn-helix domain-containing protein n=1 Tax=uncultured Roseibium sp. TaxID=1936171 RepID=UPI002617693E|nr:helix-turn-helix transcriptional regulator [uncultured Roseibium sp.]